MRYGQASFRNAGEFGQGFFAFVSQNLVIDLRIHERRTFGPFFEYDVPLAMGHARQFEPEPRGIDVVNARTISPKRSRRA